MEERDEHALNAVDSMAVAVDHLRDLLCAATAAELRARTGRRSRSAPPDQPPEP